MQLSPIPALDGEPTVRRATERDAVPVDEPATNGAHAAGREDEIPVAIAAESLVAAPATAAARAGTAGRPPMPPVPAAATPPPSAPLPPPPRGNRRPPAANAPARRGAATSPPAAARGGDAAARLQQLGSRTEGRSSGARLAMLGIAGVAVVVLVLLFVVLRGGGGSPHTASPPASPPASGRARSHTAASHPAAAAASNPATLPVAVINGTGVSGLAHHLSGDLTQNGYNNASPLAATPGTTTATTTVYYATGHRADAQGVAQVLGVSSVAPITQAIRSISGTAPVVVVAGMDQSAAVQSGTTGSGTGATG